MKLKDSVLMSPPAATSGMVLWGYPLADWVLILSIICSVVLLIEKFPVMLTRARQLYRWLTGRKSNEQEGE